MWGSVSRPQKLYQVALLPSFFFPADDFLKMVLVCLVNLVWDRVVTPHPAAGMKLAQPLQSKEVEGVDPGPPQTLDRT